MSRIMSCDLHWASFPASLSALLRRRRVQTTPTAKTIHSLTTEQTTQLDCRCCCCGMCIISWDDELQHWNCFALISLIVCVVAIWIWLWCIIISLSLSPSFQVSRRVPSWAFVWRFPTFPSHSKREKWVESSSFAFTRSQCERAQSK